MKFLHNLTLLSVIWCKNLKMLPEIPQGIERLYLNESGVEELSPSMQFLDNLVHLDMRNCINITSLPINIVLNFKIPTSVYEYSFCRDLDLSGCLNLQKLPEITGNPNFINLSETLIEELPSSIGNLSSLRKLEMTKCESLVTLPDSICELRSLQLLNLSGCSKLEKLPPNLKGLSSLRELSLDNTAVVELPSDIVFLSSLEKLRLFSCKRLQNLPKLPEHLAELQVVNCTSLKNAVSTLFIPSDIYKYDEFNYWNCTNLEENTRSKFMSDAEFIFKDCAKNNKWRKYPFEVVKVGVPGSEIPEWYSYRSEGCSIAIQFPPSFFNTNFLGFAFCVVLDPSYHPIDGLRVECECHLKNSSTQTRHSFGCKLTFHYSKDYVIPESDHVLLWSEFHDRTFSDWLIDHRFNVNEASFQFKCSSFKVKKCGVWLIYDKEDAAAAAALLPLCSSYRLLSYNEYDAGNKSRENEEEEPYPKRTKASSVPSISLNKAEWGSFLSLA